eukprot:CAMPEP_0119155826 /NCGR_PEP_ID=MMETSP1310-20130426/51946_1 /TAXON_ID=464262 /ORGANISM="Genus nov. species nov., Strain RCC2339" /LENGTH=485 /DNA_ID=CAMNT_0007148431 /DNA_START=1712 /DNA_END=3169 /DNA_ORIENTATION=-
MWKYGLISVLVCVTACQLGVRDDCDRVVGETASLYARVETGDSGRVEEWVQARGGEMRVRNGEVEVDVMVSVPRGSCKEAADELLGELANVGGGEVMAARLGTPGGPPGYDTPEQLQASFQELADDYPAIASLIDLTEAYGLPATVDGNHLYALKVSDNVAEDESDELNVLVVANHHARELVTPQIALDVASELTSRYGNSSVVRDVVNMYQVYVMYTMNPDGLNYVWSTDNMWRKNRRLVSSEGSAEVYGVDLNRNYEFGWNYTCAGSTRMGSQTYRGPYPFSEAETQVMKAFQTDRRFAKVLDLHSYAREVRRNYGSCAGLPVQIAGLFEAHSKAFATLIGYQSARSCCTGGDISYAYHNNGGLSTLVETATSFQPPADEMEAEVIRVRPGNLYYLSIPVPVTGVIRSSGAPVSATVRIVNLDWTNHEEWPNRADGRYHLWVPPGTWQVDVTPDDTNTYKSKTVTIEVSDPKETLVVDVDLNE